jgi:hypothetical protein
MPVRFAGHFSPGAQMDATNQTTRRARRELHTSELPIGQSPAIDLPDNGPIDHEQVIVPVDTPLVDSYLVGLKFAEEPVTIRISMSSEKYAPKVVDCWCNGIGAEVMMNGRWQQLGWIPVGREVTVKRKYVEILARSKIDNITTDTDDPGVENPQNRIERSTSAKVPFSVLKDDNPMGHAWLTRLMAEM